MMKSVFFILAMVAAKPVLVNRCHQVVKAGSNYLAEDYLGHRWETQVVVLVELH